MASVNLERTVLPEIHLTQRDNLELEVEEASPAAWGRGRVSA